MDEFPTLIAAIRALGPTNEVRGRVLGVSAQSVSSYLRKKMDPSIRVVARHPATLAAYCQDAQAHLAATKNTSGAAEA